MNFSLYFAMTDTLKLMEKEKDEPKQIILDRIELIELYVSKSEGNVQYQ
jgi:hypothetical protein